jgi:cytochrome c553
MASVDLKVGGVVLSTIALYTVIANIIPQVQSDVPESVVFGSEVTAEELIAAGEGLYQGAGGCTACHAESPGARAPNLLTDYRGQGPIGARCGIRIAALSCKEYLHQALVTPTDHLVDEYPPIMPATDRTMTSAQTWSIVAFLESNGGEVTVTAADVAAEPAPAGGGAAEGGAGAGGATIAAEDPAEVATALCMMCHAIGDQGTPLGPPLNGIGARLSNEEIRRAILDPRAAATPGYEELLQIMPADFGNRLTATQLESLVGYLAELP